MKRFPILLGTSFDKQYADSGLPRSVPWEILTPHEEQAKSNHMQTLKRLAERGGLCPMEMAAVLKDEPWHVARDRTPAGAVIVILAAIATCSEAKP